MAANADQSKWKDKYLSSLETHEVKENEWAEADVYLRRGLSRIALVSQGVDDGLDTYLRKLRKALQSEAPAKELNNLIEKITEHVKTLDEKRASSAAVSEEVTTTSTTDVLLQLVDAIKFPGSVDPQLWKLRAGIKAAGAEERLNDLIDEFVSLISVSFYRADRAQAETASQQSAQLTNSVSASPSTQSAAVTESRLKTEKKQSWWERLFSGGASKHEINETADDVAGANVAPPAVTDFQQKTSSAGGSTSMGETFSSAAVEDVFLAFLERLNFPSEFNDRVEQLRSQLTAGLNAVAIKQMTRSIVTLVVEMRSLLEKEKEELEQFLMQLSQRLLELDSMVEGAETDHRTAIESGRKLNAAVEAHVNDIETTVQNEGDLSQMKDLIQGSLDNIRQHFSEKQQLESDNNKGLEEQLKMMSKKLRMMEGESDQLRQRLANEREQAMTDPLTGIPNRLAYDRRMAEEFARWQRYQNSLTMLLCDVDFFKRVNDSYGHKAGDRALIAITQAITQQLRETDFLARIGGEEFVVLLTETNLDDALAVAEKLRISVEACEFVYEGKSVPVTISGGVSEFSGSDKIDEVYRRADKALYRAKEQGRNQFHAE